jgi:hypothetical protein
MSQTPCGGFGHVGSDACIVEKQRVTAAAA